MRRSLNRYSLFSITALITLGGCNLQRMALDQTAGILKQALPAFEKEWDHDLVAEAMPGTIKTVEGFLQAGPDNRDLLLLAAKSYTSYGLVILEDRYLHAEEDTPVADKLAMRTREMYMRGHRYGMRILELDHPGISAAFKKGSQDLAPFLAACTEKDVPGLFWAGMPLATAINLSREDVTMIAMVPKAKELIGKVLELNEGYYHAGSHMIFGGIYGSLGKTLGGDPDKAKKHFDRALEMTKRRFLLVHVMYAQTLAVQLQDQKLFKKLLAEVLEAKLEIFPEQKLANVTAKRRARLLMAKMDELF